MPQWLVIARSGDDPGVAARRQVVRPAHIENVTTLAAAGNILAGGALLNEDGQPLGSVAMVDFADRAALDHWLQTDPYATGNVWSTFEVTPIAVAVRAP